MGTDSIRDTFFEECEELLETLAEGLQAMADGARDGDTVNAVFRAVHSVKGGAGAFGLDDLVGFAHGFETVLDRVRDGAIDPDADLIRTFQRSGDALADLVEAARDEAPVDAAAVSALADELEATLGDGGGPAEEFSFDTVGAEFDFDAVGDVGALPDIEVGDGEAPDVDADDGGAASVPERRTWRIAFSPDRDLYATGHEPLVLLRALADLGEAAVTADLTRLPAPDFFDWEESYLAWEVALTTEAPEAAIREVFEFVDGLCGLAIEACEETAGPEDGADRQADVPSSDAPPSARAPTAEGTDAGGADDGASTPGADGAAAAEAPPVERRREPRATLRVDVERIDRLINTVGELIINQAMVTQRVRELGVRMSPELTTDLEDYKQLARDIQEGVMGLRTQPVRQLFQRMTRIARESADVAGKAARLVLAGEDTEVDKKVIEKLSDPLTHMIRNAIDHGLEAPEDRRAAGKPETGTVRLSACHKSGDVLIQIVDDGGGLNRPRIRQIAVDKGLIPADADLSDGEIDNLLFRPGFSTASSVTSLSGRGVGMDVVRTAIVALGGRISIASTPGEGSTFSIVLPLTLAVLDGMVVRVGPETMVVPVAAVEEAIRPRKADLSRLGTGGHVFASRGDYLPVVDLCESLGQGPSPMRTTKRTLLLVQSNGTRTALAVDGVIDKRQVVIKSLAKNYRAVPGVSAATILGDGKVALIIDPDTVAGGPPARPPAPSHEEAADAL